MTAGRVPYAGLATRALGLAVDVAIVQVVVFAVGAVLALVASLVGGIELGSTVAKVLGACAWAAAESLYFIVFWSLVGQTPGMRLMDVRVTTASGELPGFGRSTVRLVGLVLAIIPLFAGFLTVLVDDRRRALQDLLAGTVVLHGGAEPPPAPERAPSALGSRHGAPA
jgi:uncharacterized RDD family membrane protein YckC